MIRFFRWLLAWDARLRAEKKACVEARAKHEQLSRIMTAATKNDYQTTVTNEKGEHLRVVYHFIVFSIDGYGTRTTRIESPEMYHAKLHIGLRTATFEWVHHSKLPQGCQMVDTERMAQFKLFWGSPDA